jgi:hypothetical protein
MSVVWLDMPENFLFAQTVVEADSLILQQDGATVCMDLDEQYPGWWIGREGLINGPLRGPYLTPMDFLFWGYIKHTVYRKRITVAIAMVLVDVLSQVWGEAEFCFNVCRAVSGAHIQFH